MKKATPTVNVTVDASDLNVVIQKVERLGAALKEANAQLRELTALASKGINLEMNVEL